MRYAYSIEEVGDDYVSRIFSLRPVKPMITVIWNHREGIKEIQGLKSNFYGRIPVRIGQSLDEFAELVVKAGFLPEEAELVYFEELEKEELESF